jgi:hypothetical protein
MKRIPFGGLKPSSAGALGQGRFCDNEENPLRGIETEGPENGTEEPNIVTMKRIPFGGLKPWTSGSASAYTLSDNEENPLRGIETITATIPTTERSPNSVTMKRIPFGGLKP